VNQAGTHDLPGDRYSFVTITITPGLADWIPENRGSTRNPKARPSCCAAASSAVPGR